MLLPSFSFFAMTAQVDNEGVAGNPRYLYSCTKGTWSPLGVIMGIGGGEPGGGDIGSPGLASLRRRWCSLIEAGDGWSMIAVFEGPTCIRIPYAIAHS